MADKFRYSFVGISALVALLAVACGHEVESPPLSASPPAPSGQKGPADPDVVCVEQLTTKVTLHGDGFTPFPSQTLQKTVQLLLPTVTLTRTTAIDGSPATGTATVADDVNALAQSHVHWTSEQEMAFDVYPDLKLEPGLYDITVANRDGVHSATFPGAIAGVARPIIKAPSPDILCDAQEDQTVTLSGSGFLDLGGTLPTVRVNDKDFSVKSVDDCKAIPGVHAAGAVRTCNSVTFVIPKGSFDPGAATLKITNPGPASCASTDTISIMVVPPPTVASIAADIICDAQADNTMVVTGTGFLQIGAGLPSVKVGTVSYNATKVSGCKPVPGTFSEGSVTTCTQVSFTLTKGSLPPGDFPVVVTNPPPAACHSIEKLTLHIADVPKVTTIAADLVCDAQGDQNMVLTGTGFLQIGAALPKITVGTSTFTPTSIENCVLVPGTFTTQPVNSCTGLKFTIPKAAFTEGDYTVVVTNPPPADCMSTDAIKLHVAPPPAVTGFGQVAICDAQSAQSVNIQGTGFLTLTSGATTTFPSVTINGVLYKPSAASGCVAVAGTFTEGQVQECTGLSISIPVNSLVAGTYPVTVLNPAPAACTVTSTVTLTVEPPPTVTSVAPASICQGGGQLVVNGSGFVPTPGVALHDPAGVNPDLVGTGTTLNVANTQITTQIPSGGTPNVTYDVIVTNPDSCTDTPPHKQVRIVPGPVMFFADPEIVYNGINTRVTLYVTSLTLPVASVTMRPTGQAGPITTLVANVAANNKIQVVIPKGTTPGAYDITLVDGVNCPATLASAITVTATTTIALKSIVPPFGWTNANTDVTIFRDTTAVAPNNQPFIAVPRVFLNPTNPQPTDIAIQLTATSFTDTNTLTSVVPKGSPVHAYDLIVVNPNGTVGVLLNSFNVTALAPPTITSVTPSSVVAATGQNLVVAGTNFRASTLSIPQCADATGAPLATTVNITSGAIACNAQQVCTQAGVMDASVLPAGATCLLKLTDSDGTFAIFSAIGVTTSSLNLNKPPRFGTAMTVPRRALVAAAANATQAAKFVYAIGGDDGVNVTAPYNSAEAASVDFFGNMGPWATQRYTIGVGRSFAASAQIGRYVYVCGGTDGTNVLASCKRGRILDPLESPHLDVSDIQVGLTGLDAGYWYYRVAATFGANDLDNPNGETLPSDEIVIKVPNLIKFKVQILLSWTPPVDALGATLPNITGYRLYRTAAVNGASNSEVLIASVAGNVLTFTDDGTATPGAAKPLPTGSTGQWADLQPMQTARRGHAMSYGFDPGNANQFYVYSFFGLKDNLATPTANANYEYLQVNIQPNGHQTAASGGGAWKLGTAQTAQPRWLVGAWRADTSVSSLIPSPTNYVYVGGGFTNANASANNVEVGTVAAGGDLGAFVLPKSFTSNIAGYGTFAGNNQLFTFGGFSGASPTALAKSASIVAPPPTLANNSWNNEGLQTLENLALQGTTVQSAFIFLLGGETSAGPPIAATRNTELIVW